MDPKDLELIEELAPRHPELAALWREHLELEARLERLAGRRYLTPQEELEVKRLKKIKLAGRDRIEAILAQHRREQDGA